MWCDGDGDGDMVRVMVSVLVSVLVSDGDVRWARSGGWEVGIGVGWVSARSVV